MSGTIVPDWIAEDTRVIVLSRGGGLLAGTHARITTIKKINPKSFRVDGENTIFPFDLIRDNEATSKLIGGTWGHRRIVIPLDSDVGRRELSVLRYRNAVRRADAAVAAWQKDRTMDNKLTALDAIKGVPAPIEQEEED